MRGGLGLYGGVEWLEVVSKEKEVDPLKYSQEEYYSEHPNQPHGGKKQESSSVYMI